MKVLVYYNLHKKLWSVQDAKSRRVIAHCEHIELEDVTFHVSPAGNAKVRREKRKNVHAKVKGTVVNWSLGKMTDAGLHTNICSYQSTPTGLCIDRSLDHDYVARYNPYKQTKFEVDGCPIDSTDAVIMKRKQVYLAYNPIKIGE